MKRELQIKQLKASISGFIQDAEQIKKEIESGEAAEYEKRVGHDPGYMKELADEYLETAARLQQRLNQKQA